MPKKQKLQKSVIEDQTNIEPIEAVEAIIQPLEAPDRPSWMDQSLWDSKTTEEKIAICQKQ